MKRLRELRLQQERTQADLAKLLGVNRSVISKLELGQQIPNSNQLLKLSNYFNVSIDFLLECERSDDSNDTFDLLSLLDSNRVFIANHRLSHDERLMLKDVICAIFKKYF